MANIQSVSIIVPALNEAGNIDALVKRIESALSRKAYYEIIIVDDRSTDGTADIVQSIAAETESPLILHVKEGLQGKSYSLLEGVALATYDVICMLDADLQYPPEAIPEMLGILAHGGDVVVANRIQTETGLVRRLASRFGRNIYGKWLHRLDCDVQSGLKVFRREILDRVTVTPTRWTFDLDFLVQARDAGYMIDTVEIPFSPREHGKSKINMVSAGIEIFRNALEIKLSGHKVIPVTHDPSRKASAGFHYRGKRYITHSDLHYSESALRQLSHWQTLVLAGVVLELAALMTVNWHATVTAIVAVLTAAYFADLLYSLFLVSRSFSHQTSRAFGPEELARSSQRDWPLYTVFCPLYDEWEVLPQFVTAMSRLDYPKDKLQVMLFARRRRSRNHQERVPHESAGLL